MDGRIWLLPLLVPLAWTFLAFPAASHGRAPSNAETTASSVSKQSPPKKRPAANKRRVPKPFAAPRNARRSTALPATTDAKKKRPAMRRFAAQSLLLRRLALAGLLSRPGSGESRILESWKIRTVDGDTFWYGAERIRVRGYDAPELSQPGGFDAGRRFDALLREGEVRMYPHGLDAYGRTLADVYVDQRNVAEVMTAEGHTKKR